MLAYVLEMERKKVHVFLLLCMVSIVGLQLAETGIREDELKAKENPRSAVSHLDARDVNRSDQHVRPTDHVLVSPSTHRKKSAFQNVYFMDIRSLLNQSHRHDLSAQFAYKKSSSIGEVKNSYPEASTNADVTFETRRSFRLKKRNADRDAKRSKFAPFQVFGNLMAIRKRLPMKLMKDVNAANDAEMRLLDSLATSSSAPAEVLDQYKAAKNVERQALKETVAEEPGKAAAIIECYKTMIRDGAYDDYLYDHFKLRERHSQFFDKPSAALKEYSDLKRQEAESLDSFLKGSKQVLYKAGGPGIGNGTAKRKTHQLDSQASQLNGSLFAIFFLCIVIVFTFVDLGLAAMIGEDGLKEKNDRETSIQHQLKDFHVKHLHSVVPDNYLNETETYEEPSSAIHDAFYRDGKDRDANDRDCDDRDANDRDANDCDANDRDCDDRDANDCDANDREIRATKEWSEVSCRNTSSSYLVGPRW